MTNTTLRTASWTAVVAGLLILGSLPAAADDVEGQDAQAAFFAGLDLKEAGDCEGAVARFQLALGRDPAMYQARLHMAECYHALGLDEEAMAELIAYLTVPFPGMEEQRARDLLAECGGDPDSVITPPLDTEGGDSGDGGSGEGDVGAAPADAAEWTPVRAEVGAQVHRYANRIGLVSVGPTVGVRVLPMKYLEIAVGGAFGLGTYPDHEGLVQVPSVVVGIGASIPFKRARLVAGVSVPMLTSKIDGALRLDPGVMGEVGVRVLLGDGRLVFGAQIGGGYVVAPTVGGGICLGVQLGPLGGAR